MSTPIEDQLRSYFRMVERLQDPVDIDSVVQPAGPPTLRLVDTEETEELENIMLAPNNNDRPQRSRIVLLVAAAVAAIALVGGLLVVGDGGDEVPRPADQPPAPAVDPDPDRGVDTLPQPEPETSAGESLGAVGTEVLVPEFVMSSRIDPSGEVLSEPTVEMGDDVLGCSTLSYVDSTGGVTTDRVYTCESGERVGTFTVRFRPQSYANADFLSGWAVIATTGDFVGLRGDGIMFIDVHDTRDDAGENFVGQIDYVTGGEPLGEVGTEVLVPQFVMSSRFDPSGEVLSEPTVEMGDDVLGCSTLSYVASTGGITTDRVYTCESGERVGTFTVRFRPQSYANADFLSGWAVIATTGDFVGLRGDGIMFFDVHDTRDDAGENFVGRIAYVVPGADG